MKLRNLSIRTKITLWFSVVLILVVVITYFIVLSVGERVIQKNIRDSLIEVVENNVDEVEYFASIEDVDLSEDVDHFVRHGDGFLEVDDDFLNEVNEVYTSLCESDGTLLYGENPIALETSEMSFKNAQIQKITVGNTLYYVFDRELTLDGLEGLWLRGIVSESQGKAEMAQISRTSLILLPSLVIIAIIGGYIIARRTLRPIQEISDAASNIRQGGDLKKRIELGDGRDELHQLADIFNEMFERLDDSFQRERQFVSDASHELRTPVSVIRAQCEIALEQEQSAQEYEEALLVIQRQSRKMSKLINNMLDFARLESKADQYVFEKLDLTALVQSLCTDMALIQENNISLICVAEPGIYFKGNGELLTRLLTNLISNAYRYGRENGHIFVRLAKENDCILLSVEDDGIGIASEEQQKIFNRFYQADKSRTGVGTGLGLSMVMEIAKLHGGEISVESEPGKGSIFVFKVEKYY